jgi:hypothetical protein
MNELKPQVFSQGWWLDAEEVGHYVSALGAGSQVHQECRQRVSVRKLMLAGSQHLLFLIKTR